MIPARFAACQQNHAAERHREKSLIGSDIQAKYICS
jgi:hypothetical protein